MVGKYGVQVQMRLKKLATLDVKMICPLHGPILKENLGHYIGKYNTWSKYEAEDDGVFVAYASIHGNTKDAALELARRSRGTPRIVNRLFRRVRDFALVSGKSEIDEEITKYALDKLKVDSLGLDQTDYNLLKSIIEKFNGGPVGIEAIASSIGEEQTTIEDVYEPYLLQTGLLKRTARGRMVTKKAYDHLGIPYNDKMQ